MPLGPSELWFRNLDIPPIYERWGATPYEYLALAYKAARNSPDPSTRLGAALVAPHLDGALLVACNGPNTPASGGRIAEDRAYKMAVTQHAETAVVVAALRQFGSKVAGCEVYCPWACCADCARMLVEVEPSLVVVHTPAMNLTPEDWRADIALGYEVLQSAGIHIYQAPNPIGTAFFLRGADHPV